MTTSGPAGEQLYVTREHLARQRLGALDAAPAVRVPSDFWVVVDAIATRWTATNEPYDEGAFAAGRWIAGLTTTAPLARPGTVVPCDAINLTRCQEVSARMAKPYTAEQLSAALRPGGTPLTDRYFALGVADMIAWARGMTDRRPEMDAATREHRRRVAAAAADEDDRAARDAEWAAHLAAVDRAA